MVISILRNQNQLLPACVCPNGEYGLKDIYIGLPTIIGKSGVNKIVELKLSTQEQSMLEKSADSIRSNIKVMNQLLVAV
jgi:malate dehydrogenase